MTELSACKWLEMNRTDDAHLFGWVYPSQSTRQKNQKIGFSLNASGGGLKVSVQYFAKIDLKWIAVARIGLKLGGNGATRFRIVFKLYFYIKKCLVGITLG